jgi:K+-sensing histidine kinase KdpD
LAISDLLVNQFGGKMAVKSKPNEGSKFAFSIVLGKDDNFIDYLNNDLELAPLSEEGVS